MKEFSLEEYLKNPNRKLVTRSGREARIICTDRKSITSHAPILALVKNSNNEEIAHTYYPNGMNLALGKHDNDLFFAPEKHEGWVNVYHNGYCYRFDNNYPFATEKEAKDNSLAPNVEIGYEYVGTIKVEWED